MGRVHKANLWMTFVCVVALTATTIASYGMSMKSVQGSVVMWITMIICLTVFLLKVSDFVKALVIVMCPSYAVLLYSYIVDGNSIAYLASFVTLGFAVRYFDKRVIKYYTVPFSVVSLLCIFIDYKMIDSSRIGSISKVCMFAATSVLIYLGTKFAEKKINQAQESLKTIQANTAVANKIAYTLNSEIVECDSQVQEVAVQAETVKISAEQMEQVVDDTSRSITTVSEKLNMSKGHIDKNYSYAQQLENSFAEVNEAVTGGNEEAKRVQESMVEMADSVEDASKATSGLLEQMDKITGILNDINDIASQTNLLSLNASIEAARAGEHGKGFAVVADQIRSLSEDSRKSADSIKDIITALTETVNDVVEKISAGADAARESSEQIEDLIGKLETVNRSAEEATTICKEEYEIIGVVKEAFEDIQQELDSVAAASEENTSMVAEIGNSIVNQTDSVLRLSDSVGNLKKSSERLEEHFSE